jgi:hypothetical protein
VHIYGHYAVRATDTGHCLGFHRHKIGSYALTVPADRYKPYNFIRNLYDRFAPEHLQRIQDAATELHALLPTTAEKRAAPSEASPADEDGVKNPRPSDEKLHEVEIEILQAQLKQERRDRIERENYDREQHKRREEQMEEQLKDLQKEQDRKEGKMEEQLKDMQEEQKRKEEKMEE